MSGCDFSSFYPQHFSSSMIHLSPRHMSKSSQTVAPAPLIHSCLILSILVTPNTDHLPLCLHHLLTIKLVSPLLTSPHITPVTLLHPVHPACTLSTSLPHTSSPWTVDHKCLNSSTFLTSTAPFRCPPSHSPVCPVFFLPSFPSSLVQSSASLIPNSSLLSLQITVSSANIMVHV